MSEETHVDGQELDTAPVEDGQESSQQPETFSRDYVEKLRKEAAQNRVLAKQLQDKLSELETADLSEREKLQKQVTTLTEQVSTSTQALRQERARVAITQAAVKHKIAPDLAEKLVTIEFDDEGNPLEVEAKVAALIKTHPYLVQAAGNGSPTNPSRPKTTLTREAIKKMTAEEINTNWEEVQKVLAGG